MHLLLNRSTPLIGGFSEELTEDERRTFTWHEIDVEACEDACEAVVDSKGNSYLVSDEAAIKDLYRAGDDRQLFFKLEGKVLKPVAVSQAAKQYAALGDEIAKCMKLLQDTDWVVVKCMELGIKLSDAYPDTHQKRVQARAQINENQQKMRQL